MKLSAESYAIICEDLENDCNNLETEEERKPYMKALKEIDKIYNALLKKGTK